MGMDLSAKIMFGYPLPDHEYEDFDPKAIWFERYAPDEIKALDLTAEEHATWNALPFAGVGFVPNPRTSEQQCQHETFRNKYLAYAKAKNEWETEHPCPVDVEHSGHGHGDLEHFLVALKPDGTKFGVEAGWSPERLNLIKFDIEVDQKVADEVQDTLDHFCEIAGIDPEGAEVDWHLAPLYW